MAEDLLYKNFVDLFAAQTWFIRHLDPEGKLTPEELIDKPVPYSEFKNIAKEELRPEVYNYIVESFENKDDVLSWIEFMDIREELVKPTAGEWFGLVVRLGIYAHRTWAKGLASR